MISVQTLVMQSLGAGRERQAIDALHSACVVVLLVGAAITLAILLVLGGILLVVTDGELAEKYIIYLQTLICTRPAIGCVRAFRGYSLVSAGLLGIRGACLGTITAGI